MATVYLCGISVVIACLIGIPVGLAASRSDRFERIITPFIDTLAGHPCPYGAPCLCDISVAEVGEALRAQLTSSRIARTSAGAAVHA
jgi:ABC-type proline/glycine betaine transport system permease subunit